MPNGSNERKRCHCPCCGMMVDVERFDVDQAYELNAYLQTWGGKVAMDREARLATKRKETYRGSGAGTMSYEPIALPRGLKQKIIRQAERVLAALKG